MSVILPIVIFVSWFAFVLVPAGRLAIEDERNNVPKDKRRGTSILPGFPIFPLIAWGVALVVNYFIPPWGLWAFLGIHGILLAVSLCIIARDMFLLSRIKT
jgi:hypothetical protein